MARKNPLGKLVDTAVDALKNPVGTAGKVVDQARGTASLGRLAAEQVTKAAASTALGAAGAVAERAGVRKPSARPSARAGETEPTSPADLRPVPSVNEPAHPPVEKRTEPARVASTTARKAPAKKADGSAPTGKKAAATKAPATKAPATKAPASKAPAKKAPAKKAPAKKTAKPTTDRVRPAAPEPKAVPDRRAAEPASGRQERALSPNPEQVAKKAAAKGAAANEAPAKRVAASKTVKPAPAKKAPAKKGAAKKTAKKSAAKVAESRGVSPVAEDETVWSTSTPGDKLPAGRGKRNEADPEVPVTREDLEAAREATPADVAERVEGD